MNKKRVFKIAAVIYIIALVTVASIMGFLVWSNQYPNYLMFQPRILIQARNYTLQLTSFITDYWITPQQHMNPQQPTSILAYWRMLTLEENYLDRWNLEVFDSHQITKENDTHILVETKSHLWTQTITKHYTFIRNESYFLATINRTYTTEGTNKNNQIIFDINNKEIFTDGKTWATYQLETGTLTYTILDASPNNVTIQTGHPTETQINFYGASDNTERFHRQGEQEILVVKILISVGSLSKE